MSYDIKKIPHFFTILLGCAIYFWIDLFFVVPHHLFEGGATGITHHSFYLLNPFFPFMPADYNTPFHPSLEDLWSQIPLF